MSVDVFWAKPLILELASNFSSFFRCLQMVFCFSSTSSPIHLDSSSPETDTYICTVLSSDFCPLGETRVGWGGPSHSASEQKQIHRFPYHPIHFAVSSTEHFSVKEGITGVLGHRFTHRLVSLGC